MPGEMGGMPNSIWAKIFEGIVLGGTFGGWRASGGAVDGSQFYLVGENGPELFAPGMSGSVLPNSVMRHIGRAEGPISQTFVFNGPVSNPEQVRRSAAQAGAQLARAAAAGKRGV